MGGESSGGRRDNRGSFAPPAREMADRQGMPSSAPRPIVRALSLLRIKRDEGRKEPTTETNEALLTSAFPTSSFDGSSTIKNSQHGFFDKRRVGWGRAWERGRGECVENDYDDDDCTGSESCVSERSGRLFPSPKGWDIEEKMHFVAFDSRPEENDVVEKPFDDFESFPPLEDMEGGEESAGEDNVYQWGSDGDIPPASRIAIVDVMSGEEEEEDAPNSPFVMTSTPSLQLMRSRSIMELDTDTDLQDSEGGRLDETLSSREVIIQSKGSMGSASGSTSSAVVINMLVRNRSTDEQETYMVNLGDGIFIGKEGQGRGGGPGRVGAATRPLRSGREDPPAEVDENAPSRYGLCRIGFPHACNEAWQHQGGKRLT